MDDGASAPLADRAKSPAFPSGAGGSAYDFDRELVALLPRLRAQALALTHNRADADDLVQDAVRNALAARGSFTPDGSLTPWLLRILRNRFISNRRRASEETGQAEDIAGAAAPPAPGAQEDALALGELRRAVGRLPAGQRVALVAVAVHGMRYEELAAATGCTTGTAKAHVFRARNKLHAALLGPGAAPRRSQHVRANRRRSGAPPVEECGLISGGGAT
jgi:RNA polymerase sigma-70 factor (ECF subfamily)